MCLAQLPIRVRFCLGTTCLRPLAALLLIAFRHLSYRKYLEPIWLNVVGFRVVADH